MTDKKFVHLHTHSDFSLLDGVISVEDIVKLAAADNQPGVAITDHGSMAGTIQLFKHAAAAGITPIPGLEAYYVPDVSEIQRQKDSGISVNKERFHMILLAVNDTGYKNLMKIQSVSSLENYYYKPLTDDALFEKYHEGIVATSGCLGSAVNKALTAGDFDSALRIAADHRDIFGKENYYIEIQNHNIPDQLKILPDQLRLAKKLGIPLLAAQDSHYGHRHDAEMHENALAMQTGSKLSDESRFKFDSDENFFRTAEEMYELFPESDFPGACRNTLDIEERAREINSPISETNYLIPEFPTENGESEAEALLNLVMDGAKEKYGRGKNQSIPKEIMERIEYELGVINKMGFNGYFLMTADIVGAAKDKGYLVGPGRGSAPGSIIAYLTGITTVDPIRYGLYFERFLNPDRISMPDIDIDFEPSSRADMVTYTQEKYGYDRVAKIATYSAFKPKSALQKAAHILGMSNKVSSLASGLWPGAIDGEEATLALVMKDESPDEDDRFYHHWRAGRSLREFAKKDSEIAEMFRVAMGVEGIHNNHGTHAAAVLITPHALTNYVPLHRAKREDDKVPVCEYDKNDSEAIGGLKMDFLGLINLEIIKKTLASIKSDLGVEIDIEKVPLDDKKTFEMLSAGETDGVFQLTSPGMRDLLRKVGPSSIEDLSAVLALYRPGPMGTNLHLAYADAKNGRAIPSVPHDDMRELFKETHSVLCYQEQVMALSQHYAGYTAAQADGFRKAVGKKSATAVAAEEIPFKAGVIANGYGEKVADELWAMIPPFAAYAFNKAHSVVYAFIAYWTGWLKANYTAQYAAACIDTQDRDRRTAQVASARKMKVNVFAPNINKSNGDSSTGKDSIWLGLSGVRNCGGSTLSNILVERKRNGDFTSIGDFMVRMAGVGGLNKQAIYHLTAAGAFDTMISSRLALHKNLDEMLAESRVSAKSKKASDGLFGLFDEVIAEVPLSSFDLTGEDYSVADKISAEIEALGFAAGDHPFTLVRPIIASAQESGTIDPRAFEIGSKNMTEGAQVFLYGTVTAHKVRNSKSGGRPQHNFILENDEGDSIDVVWYGGTDSTISNGHFAVVGGTYQKREFNDSDGNPIEKEEIRASSVLSNSIDSLLDGNSFAMTTAKGDDIHRSLVNKKRMERRSRNGSSDSAPEEDKSRNDIPEDNYDALISSRRRRSRSAEELNAPTEVSEEPVVVKEKPEVSKVTFHAKTKEDLQDLMDAMESMVAGEVLITLKHDTKVYAADEGVKISLRGIERIAKIVDVEFDYS